MNYEWSIQLFCRIYYTIDYLVKRDRMLEAARSVRAGRMGQKDEGKQHPN